MSNEDCANFESVEISLTDRKYTDLLNVFALDLVTNAKISYSRFGEHPCLSSKYSRTCRDDPCGR